MRSSKPPAVATWLLEHFRCGSGNDHITGDLMEAYRRGRSRGWYWKQVLAAIVISFCQAIMAHPMLALRAIALGWGISFLFHYGVAPRLLVPLVRRFFMDSGFPFAPSALIWWMLSLIVSAASGWVVARFHRSHRTGMVMAFAVSVFVFQLRMLPWIGSLAGDVLTNTRFLPYLIFDLESVFLPPVAILLGGLWGASPESESEVQEAHSAV